jgi:hypothetical protein
MATRKLISRCDTLPGVITFPDQWDEILREQRWVRFRADKPGPIFPARGQEQTSSLTFAVGALWNALSLAFPGAVHLCDISIEEFEALPG